MKNILILKFPYSSLFGGGEHHTTTIVENMKQAGFNFFLISSCPVLLKEFKKRNWHYEYIKSPKEPVSKGSILLFPFLAPFFYFKLKKIIKKYISENKINTIYCLSLTEKILFGKWLKKNKINIVWMEHVNTGRWLSKNPYKFLYRKNSNYSKIITASKSIKQDLLSLGIRENNVYNIYFGIKISESDKNPFIRQSVNLNNFKIGSIGRLESEKGIDILISAFSKIIETDPNNKLIIVGDGPAKQDLMNLCDELNITNKVEFTGFRTDLPELLKNMDLFVLPSAKRESFGIVLLEALKYQLPIVASNLGGIPEIIQDNKYGILFEPGNYQELTSKIIWVKQNYKAAILKATDGQNMVHKKFNLKNTIDKFAEIFSNEN